MRAHYADLWREVAEAVPARQAIVTVGGPVISYQEFDELASSLAAALGELGIKPGDKLSILMHNRAEWLVAFTAALKMGVAPVALNFRLSAAEITALLDDSDTSVLVYPSALADVAVEAVGDRSMHLIEVTDGAAPTVPGALDFAELTAHVRPEPTPAPDGEFLIYTGGTTGAPKGVVWGVRDMLEMQLFNAYTTIGLAIPQSEAEVVATAIDPATPRMATLPLAPLMHGTALTSVINTFLLGGTVVLIPSARFDPELAARTILEEQVTRITVAGDVIAIPLLDAFDAMGVSEVPPLSSVVSSGMRLSDETKARLHRLGQVTIVDILASTEGGALAIALTSSVEELPSRLRPTPGAAVLDDDLRDVLQVPGATGRIAYGGGMPKGYYKDPVKTAATFLVIDGRRFVVPGDMVRVAPDGFIELLGRGSNVVNSGGEKVFPAEVEESLMRHPAVMDAVVYGMPDPRWGEIVAAAVAVDGTVAGARVTPAELAAHVGAELAGFKKPRILLVLDDLHRGPTGKVELQSLREQTSLHGVRP